MAVGYFRPGGTPFCRSALFRLCGVQPGDDRAGSARHDLIADWPGSMKQSPLLEFESSAFAVIPGEDEETNPGIYGKALAHWMAEQLRAAGFPVGEVVAEDFGWCVPVSSSPHRLYVVCSSTGATPQHWRAFVFAEGGG